MTRPRNSLLLVLIVSMILSALIPGRVLADDSTPPPPDVEENVTPEPSEPLEEEQQIEGSTEVSGVEVVIVDENGQSVPVESQEGEAALLNGQPVWCPEDSVPNEEENCTASYGSIGELLTDVTEETLPQDGTIYIQTTNAEVTDVAEMPSAEVAAEVTQEIENSLVGVLVGSEMMDVADLTPNLQAQDSSLCDSSGSLEGENAVCSESGESQVIEAEIVESNPGDEIGVVSTDLPLAPPVDVDESDGASVEAPTAGETASNEEILRDPVWCPDSTASPTPGNNGCTSSFATLGELVDYLLINQPGSDGTIWIEQGEDNSTAAIVIDGNVASTWADFALTLQGGWIGISGDESIIGDSVVTNPILIVSWVGDVSINDVLVENTSATGINVQTEGNIALHNVSSTGNDGDGVWLENCGYIFDNSDPDPANWDWRCMGSGTSSVSVTGSSNSFNDNGNSAIGGTGLNVLTNGDIYLENITASGNEMDGSGSGGIGVIARATSGNITLTGQNTFNNNTETGASFGIGGSGNLYLENLNVNTSGWNGVGAYLNTGDAIVSGVNTFENTRGDAIIIYSNGDIYAENLNTNNTGGIHLETHSGSVFLTGSNLFNNTIYQGHVVFIQAANDIFIEGVTSVNGQNGDGIKLGSGGNVTINCSYSANNSEYGLEVGFDDWVTGLPSYYPSSLTLNNVAFSNNGFGDYIANGGGTLISNNSNYLCAAAGGDDTGSAPVQTGQPHSLPQPLPLNIVVLGDAGSQTPVSLDCDTYSGIVLSLTNGASITYMCPVTGSANLTMFGNLDGLPGPLPERNTFVFGLSTALMEGSLSIVDGHVLISFPIPADMLEADFSILYWDGANWVDLSSAVFADGRVVYNGGSRTEDGAFQAETNFSGLFVLVRK